MLKINPKFKAIPLQEGDEVHTAAVSSVIENDKSLLEGLSVLSSWGLKCRSHDVIGRKWGNLAGKDSKRYEELHESPPAPLIAFARGGWGAARILERNQPWKRGWLLGFSDISSILLSRISSGFDGGIHGPLLTSLSEEPQWSKERLKAILFGNSVPPVFGNTWTNGGIAKGPIIVTNLTVASHLIGSNHMPNLNGCILVFEDIGEAPYRIDRMLTQWRLAGILQKVAGIGFGNFRVNSLNEETLDNDDPEIKKVLIERTEDLGIPVIGNLPIGHCKGNASFPIGHMATIDGSESSISLGAY